MPKSRRWDKVFVTASWIIVVALLFSAGSLWITPPTGAGPAAKLIGITGSQWFYALLYLSEALALAYSKLFKRHRMRKVVLLVIYLTGVFTFLLTLIINGVAVKLIDNLIVSFGAGFCWLYWKFRSEYISYEEIDDYASKDD